MAPGYSKARGFVFMIFKQTDSILNSSSTVLAAGATFTGTAELVVMFPSVIASLKTDQDGTLYLEFSPDGTNWDSSLSYSVAASTNEVHRLTITRKYFRARFTNTSASPQTYFRLQVLFGDHTSLVSPMSAGIQADADATVSRSVLYGLHDNGDIRHVPVTPEGHVEVAVHDPVLPFGSVHTESLHPEFQIDAVYGLNTTLIQPTTYLSGTATAANNLFTCTTGVTQYGYGVLQSRRRARYRPGQGLVCRFTALWGTPAASSIVVAGIGSAESGFYFGYNGTSFGILHSTGGVREIQTLTITTKSSTVENITVTLNGVATSVAVTNGASTATTAYEISKGTYAGWTAQQRGSTVIFLANDVGNKSSTFSISGSTVVGAFAETLAGVASTDTWIPQSSWNADTMDGNGPSGVTLDPTKGNVFQIGIQYLGFGSIVFKVEVCPDDANNPTFEAVHVIRFPNIRTTPTLRNPSMPFTMAAYSAGSTTNVSVSVASIAAFVEGKKHLIGPRFTYSAQSTAVDAASYRALFTVRNDSVYNSKANQSIINMLSFSGAVKHTQPVTVYLIRNATLAGTPSFTQHSTSSCSYVDTSATTCTFSDNSQVIISSQLAETGNFFLQFVDEITLQPGETVTLAAKASTGTPAYVLGSLNTREDQ